MAQNRQSQPDIHRSGQSVLNWSFDEEFDVLAVENLLYNEAEGSLHRQGAFGNVGYVLFDADDSQPDYIGINSDADAATSDSDWVIYKFAYTGSNATSIRKKTGAWDDRVSLFA